MNAPAPVLVIDGLTKSWPDGSVGIDRVSLTVGAGEIVAVLGGSGAGKSTLLRTAARLIEPNAGRVRVGDRELRSASATIGFVFQQFNLIRTYSALDNVLTGRIARVSWFRGLVGLFGPADHEIARRCLADVGMQDKANAIVRDLSGGQQQRVAIARAFAQEPRALFADEPTASLDPKLAGTVLDMLGAYCKKNGVPALINVHTVEHARKIADRVVGLRRGRVVWDGPAATLDQGALDTIYSVEEAV